MVFISTSPEVSSDIAQLLEKMFNTVWFWPAVIFFLLAAVFNPKGPTIGNQLIVSFICGSIAGYSTMTFFRAAPLDATLVGLIILFTGLIWLATASDGMRGRIIYLIFAFVIAAVVIGISVANPTTIVPQLVIFGWNALQSMFNAVLSWILGAF